MRLLKKLLLQFFIIPVGSVGMGICVTIMFLAVLSHELWSETEL